MVHAIYLAENIDISRLHRRFTPAKFESGEIIFEGKRRILEIGCGIVYNKIVGAYSEQPGGILDCEWDF